MLTKQSKLNKKFIKRIMSFPSKKSWYIKRLQALARDNCTCQICEEETTEVHHKDGTGSNFPEKQKNHSLDNLITLCHKCHSRIHLENKKKRNKRIIQLSKFLTQVAIAKLYNITRQRVNQIIKVGH